MISFFKLHHSPHLTPRYSYHTILKKALQRLYLLRVDVADIRLLFTVDLDAEKCLLSNFAKLGASNESRSIMWHQCQVA